MFYKKFISVIVLCTLAGCGASKQDKVVMFLTCEIAADALHQQAAQDDIREKHNYFIRTEYSTRSAKVYVDSVYLAKDKISGIGNSDMKDNYLDVYNSSDCQVLHLHGLLDANEVETVKPLSGIWNPQLN